MAGNPVNVKCAHVGCGKRWVHRHGSRASSTTGEGMTTRYWCCQEHYDARHGIPPHEGLLPSDGPLMDGGRHFETGVAHA